MVALLLPRGADLVVAMLGAWQAGFAFSPLEPAQPVARIRSYLDDLGACAVLTTDPSLVDDLDVGAIDLGSVGSLAGAPAVEPPDPASTACVLYTAGTTGEPAGVAHSHRGLSLATPGDAEAFELSTGDRVSWIHEVASARTQRDVWQALVTGAELLPYERPVVATELAAWADEQGVTRLSAPAPLAEQLWAAHAELPTVRWLAVDGALTTLPPAGTGYRVCAAYDPAEAGRATRHDLVAADATALNCAGRPGAGVRVYVLDAAGRRCPVGVPGEIHVGGATVAQGYWRRPDLTRERFAEDGAAGRVYRTGDRGRWLPDGTLEYLGRLHGGEGLDGYRSIMRIESCLSDDPLVAKAVVAHLPDEPVPLVAYAVASPGTDTDAGTRAVLSRLRLALPESLVPGALIWLAELPVNRRGKIDMGALPRPARPGQQAGGLPAAGMEQRIAAVWCAVLGLESVGAHDNFFDLGGNSLLLARLHARLQAQLATTLPIRRLVEHPTVHTLAAALTSCPATESRVTGGTGARDGGSQIRAALAHRTRPTR